MQDHGYLFINLATFICQKSHNALLDKVLALPAKLFLQSITQESQNVLPLRSFFIGTYSTHKPDSFLL